jgi:hypothetical protein
MQPLIPRLFAPAGKKKEEIEPNYETGEQRKTPQKVLMPRFLQFRSN